MTDYMTDYVELHCHSHYSLLDGASSPEALLKQARELGMPTLALTDHDNLYGAVEFAMLARQQGIRPIHGAELTLHDHSHITLLVRNEQGWRNLCWLITQAQHNAPKGEAVLQDGVLIGHSDGLIALSGCRQGRVMSALLRRDRRAALSAVAEQMDLFGRDNYWLELQHHILPEDDDLIDTLTAMARRLHIGTVATNNVHYAVRDRSRLQDILTCIRHSTNLDDGQKYLRPSSEYYLKSAQEMAALFANFPNALANTLAIADRCQFDLKTMPQELPDYLVPDDVSAAKYLMMLCYSSTRYKPQMHQRLMHEMDIIRRAGLENYFLVVWDIVQFARGRGVRCQGRGSAANSLIAYLLHISPVNPLKYDLVFERFLSDERSLVPDIDIDFDNSLREEVIQYVYEKYGADHAAMACTFITFQARSAVRDVGKALGLSSAMVDTMAKSLDVRSLDHMQDYSTAPIGALLLDLCQQIEGIPRHLSIHNGGMILTRQPLSDYVPTEPAAMPGRVVVQWDKEGLADAGIVKIDILGLGMLAMISEAAEMAAVNVDDLSFDDPAVYAMISEADTVGVFQVESRAQMNTTPRFQPKTFEDIIILISLIRPGPIQGNMVHPYIRRRLGEEDVDYFHPRLEKALKSTLGVILFQEDVLKVARDLAGFTPGQGELLRRALGKKDATAALKQFEAQFVAGCLANDVDMETAYTVFEKLLGFGSYSFPKSHAAAFAVAVYQSAWLRKYHPHAFYAALLNNQPMGFYTPAVIVNDARRHGVRILKPHINLSQERCTIEQTANQKAVRLGLKYIRGLGPGAMEKVLSARAVGEFANLEDLHRRVRLSMRSLEYIIMAGALDHFGISRRQLFWDLGKLQHKRGDLDLAFAADDIDLPSISPVEAMQLELQGSQVSTHKHVMEFYRAWCNQHGVKHSQMLTSCKQQTIVHVAGQLVVRQQPPTAKGFQFLTLEDEFGFFNIIVKPDVRQAYRFVIQGASILLVSGLIQQENGVINVVAQQFKRLEPLRA